MKMLRDLCLAIFVSPEFLAATLFFGVYIITPGSFHLLGLRLSQSPEAFKWVSVAPAGILLFALGCARDTLLPKASQADMLAKWPDFWILKNRILVGLAYVFVTACTTVGLWASGANLSRASLGAIYLSAIAINLIATGTLWYASIQVGIRLRRLSSQGI